MGPAKPIDASSTGTKITGAGALSGITLTPAAALSTLTVYDNTSAAGTIIEQLQAAASGASVRAEYPGGLVFSKGIHVVITGAGAKAMLDQVA